MINHYSSPIQPLWSSQVGKWNLPRFSKRICKHPILNGKQNNLLSLRFNIFTKFKCFYIKQSQFQYFVDLKCSIVGRSHYFTEETSLIDVLVLCLANF